MASAQVFQSGVNIFGLQNPKAQVFQSGINIFCIPGNTPPTPSGGQGVSISGGTATMPAFMRSRGGCYPKGTRYDACLEDQATKIRRITFPPSCTIPQAYKELLPWDEEFGA